MLKIRDENEMPPKAARWRIAGRTAAWVVLVLGAISCRGSIQLTQTTSGVFPHDGAPVTAHILRDDLVVANHRPNEIFHVIFPSEILPLIEWAPCWEPDRCDESLRIGPDGSKTYSIASLKEEETRELSLFWWELIYDETLSGYRWPEAERVTIPLDKSSR
jgi:hypothetical protein